VAEKYGKKLLGENEIKAVLQRLDRLSIEESREVAAQTLDVVYGLVKNIEVIMEGAYGIINRLCCYVIGMKHGRVDGKASIGAIRQALGACG
jgi:hypothetical protein